MLKSRSKALTATFLCAILSFALVGIATADPLELLTHGSSGYINDAYFLQVDPENSTGTGLIQPFLHVQDNGVEEGYNTDYSPKQFPETTSPWTKSLLLDDVPVVTLGGVDYREFLLDINESGGGGNEFISLDELQIFLGGAGDLTNYPFDGTATKVWDMNPALTDDNWIYLDYSLEAGSGDGDMLAYIPDRLFTGGSYLYLYCKFGAQGGGLDCSDGFEEWAIRVDEETVVPEPGSLLALSTGLLSLIGLGRRRFGK